MHPTGATMKAGAAHAGSEKVRTIHYVNQYFAGLGAEEQAGMRPQWLGGARGPGRLL
ncbi:MAG: glycine/sarcosine/betaine reductase selenoprotein B family protein, partial [Gammaproteobacteria bacterium]